MFTPITNAQYESDPGTAQRGSQRGVRERTVSRGVRALLAYRHNGLSVRTVGDMGMLRTCKLGIDEPDGPMDVIPTHASSRALCSEIVCENYAWISMYSVSRALMAESNKAYRAR